MHLSNSEIRARARETLDNNIFSSKFLLLIAMTIVSSLIIGAANYLCCGLGTLLLCGPLYVGLYKAYLRTVRGDSSVKFGSLFDGCGDDFGQNLVLGVMHTLMLTLWTFLLIIPGLIKSYSYALVYYIKSDHPEYSWRECLTESERMMRGHKMRLFMLQLSFIGWMLLSALTCGIGAIWVNTYIQTATAVFYEDLKSKEMYL